MGEISQVSIALKPNVYTTFRDLPNTLSNTLGEYVDNAVQSYIDNKATLKNYEPNYKLRIDIIMDWEKKTLSIIDNAAGISEENYIRAFEPANIPENKDGLNEYGMGMKTASVWLSDNWIVTTKALGESKERILSFDLNKVIAEERELLEVVENKKPKKEHYTRIVLSNLSKNAPKLSHFDKIKRHLSSIYRTFLRTDEIEIYVNDGKTTEKLVAPKYKILNAPFYKTPDGKNILWKKEIHFDAGKYKANGFIALLETMNKDENGLVLLRRGRVIVGGEDEHFFPSDICGSVGSPRYKRLFGELELEGFEVSFNKNSFKEEDDLKCFLKDVKNELNREEFSIFTQGEHYREPAKDKKDKIARKIKEKKLEEKSSLKKDKIEQEEKRIQDFKMLQKDENLITKSTASETYEESFILNNEQCKLQCELITDTKSASLYSVICNNKKYICKINISHKFFDCYPQFKTEKGYEPFIKIITAFAKAEIKAPEKGTSNAGNLRTLFNQYIREDD